MYMYLSFSFSNICLNFWQTFCMYLLDKMLYLLMNQILNHKTNCWYSKSNYICNQSWNKIHKTNSIVKLQVQVQVRSRSMFQSKTNLKLKSKIRTWRDTIIKCPHRHPPPPPPLNFSKLKISSFQPYPLGSGPAQVPTWYRWVGGKLLKLLNCQLGSEPYGSQL